MVEGAIHEASGIPGWIEGTTAAGISELFPRKPFLGIWILPVEAGERASRHHRATGAARCVVCQMAP